MTIRITTEYITLDSALKLANLVSTGGEAKNVILDELVEVNGEICTMRGKKLRPGDTFAYDGETVKVAKKPVLKVAKKQ